MERLEKKRITLKKRHIRVKKKLRNSGRSRLTVYRSNRYIYAQIVDAITGKTMFAASTLTKELKKNTSVENKTSASRRVGELIAKMALEGGVGEVVFNRNGFLYHGRIKALADGARDAGLKF
jgi:large subunit ribosomal protein L18